MNNCYLPMAFFKVAFDVVYLTRLLGAKGLLAGALFPVAGIMLSNSTAKRHQTAQTEHFKTQENVTNVITQALQNLHNISISSVERFWQRRLINVTSAEGSKRWTTGLQLQRLNLFASLGPVLLTSVAISVHALETGNLSPAVIFTALNLFASLHEVFSQLPTKAATLQKAWMSLIKQNALYQL